MKFDTIIGIDPGAMGGIAVWRDGQINTLKMPRKVDDLADFLRHYKDVSESPVAILEKLQVRPDDISVPGKMYRIQSMLENYERLKYTLEEVGIPYVQVHPMTWQTGLNLRRKGEEKAARKKRYKDVASEMCRIKATLWNADALLMMAFGKKMADNDEGEWIEQRIPKKVRSLFG